MNRLWLQLQLNCIYDCDFRHIAALNISCLILLPWKYKCCWDWMCIIKKKASVVSQLMWLGPFPTHFWCLLLSASPLLCLHTPIYCLCMWAVCWTQLGAGEYQPNRDLALDCAETACLSLSISFNGHLAPLANKAVHSFFLHLDRGLLFFSSFPVLFAPVVCWLE